MFDVIECQLVKWLEMEKWENPGFAGVQIQSEKAFNLIHTRLQVF